MSVLRLLPLVSILWLAGCPSELPPRPVELTLNDCGGTTALTEELGGDCCLGGTWTCHGLDQLVCLGADGRAADNGCGGCQEIDVPECGACSDPQCDGENAMACGLDRTDDRCGEGMCGRLSCNESTGDWVCNPPSDTPGDACGVCKAGTFACVDGDVVCDQPGLFEEVVPGRTRCGFCDTGVWECGETGLECTATQMTKEDADSTCACGEAVCVDGGGDFTCTDQLKSCGPCRGMQCDLDDCARDRVGDDCLDCGTLVCAGESPDDLWVCAANAALGTSCGVCGAGALVCTERGVECAQPEGFTGDEVPGESPCGYCGTGVLHCGGQGPECVGAASQADACGCGGRLDCDGLDGLVCVGETRNACGGCDLEIDARLEDPACGACGMGTLACDGTDALTCTNERLGVNTCGGCGELQADWGEPCGECARWTCGDGVLVCEELDRDRCGRCVDEDLAPPPPCGLCNQGVEACGDDNQIYCDETDIAMPGEACEGGHLVCVGDALACEPTPEGWIAIPGGSYCMGTPVDRACRNQEFGATDTEQPTPTVITRPFLVMAHELTRERWLEYAPDAIFGACNCDDDCDARCPADHMTWFEALDYANWRSRGEGLTECYPSEVADWAQTPPTGAAAGLAIDQVIEHLDLSCDGYRLPTESEWEYAARAGSPTRSHIPGELQVCVRSVTPEPILDPVAWWSANSGDLVHPTGTKLPNAWGLHDTLGNVAEMVMAQQYASIAETVPTYDRVWRSRWASNQYNALVRGGGANSYGWTIGLGAKRATSASTGDERLGFRLVRTLPTPDTMRMQHYWTVPVCQ